MLLVKMIIDEYAIHCTFNSQMYIYFQPSPPSPDTPTITSAYVPAASRSLTHVTVHGALTGRDMGNHNVLTDRMEISASGPAKSALNYRSKEQNKY